MPRTKGTRTPSGIPAGGPGYGGPAKGYVHKPARAWTPDQPTQHRFTGDATPERRAEKMSRQQQLDQMAQEWLERVNKLKDDPEVPAQVIVKAAETIMNRAWGTPVARTINANVDDVSQLSDAELRAELERTGGAAPEAAAGDEAAGVSKVSARVH